MNAATANDTIELHGEFHRKGIGGDPVVFIDEPEHGTLLGYRRDQEIFTKLMEERHPKTSKKCYVVYISATDAQAFSQEGERAKVTLSPRPEKRGVGLRVKAVPDR